MSDRFKITYYDRPAGARKQESVFASAFLNWSYNTAVGRFLSGFIMGRRTVTAVIGWFSRRRASRRLIRPFARRMNIRLSELAQPPERFACFNDFFIREIDRHRRPLPPNPAVCVSPADAKAMAFTDVKPDQTYRVKRSLFNLCALLKSASLAKRFARGTVVILRLTLADYHHFHFPVSGTPSGSVAVSGAYHAGGPYSRGRDVSFFGENYRMRTLIESDRFALVGMVEVGAFTVGSIKQSFRPGRYVNRGDQKGRFELGGSTIVLVFQAGKVTIDHDILIHSASNIETRLLMGQSLGTGVVARKIPQFRVAEVG